MLSKQVKDRLGSRNRWSAGIWLLVVVGAVCIFAGPAKSHFTAPAARPVEKNSPLNARLSTTIPVEQAHIASSLTNGSLSFEPNLGQSDPQVKFTARGDGYQLFLTPAKAVMSLAHPRKLNPRSDADHATTPADKRASVVQMEFVGARNQPEISASDLLPGVSNYFIGDDPHRWATGVPHYGQVNYRDVYPGVSLHFSGEGPEVGLGFVVAAGADPSAVHLRFQGATRVNTDADGGLAVAAETGILHFHTLRAFQQIQGKSQPVDANFEVREGGGVVLALGAYDHSRDLVIDANSTNSASAQSSVAATNQSWLLSLAWVPMVGIALAGVGAVQRKRLFASLLFCLSIAGLAVMVACGNGQGTSGGGGGGGGGGGSGSGALSFGTYLGGSADDQGLAIAVDGSGNVFVAGDSGSSNFPGSPTFVGGAHDAFVTKLSSSGAVQFTTFIGGTLDDAATGITLQGGNIFLVGNTQAGSGFPSIAPAIGPRGGQDVFVAEFNSSGTMTTTTIIGGGLNDTALGIALDGNGNVYIAGETKSTNFPTLLPFQAALSGTADAFIAKLTSGAGALTFSTYLGGTQADLASGIAVDGNSVYISGQTSSLDLGNPGTSTFGGGIEDGFVAKFDSTSGNETYFVYIGGTGDDVANAIAVDGTGIAYVTGFTQSSGLASGSAFQTTLKGTQDAFVAQINADGSKGYFTYLGGTNSKDEGKAIAIDTAKNAYVTGCTDSSDFPVKNAITGATTLKGSSDAFVTELNPAGSAQVFSTYYGGSGSEDLNGSTPGGAIAADGTNIFVTGTTDSSSGLPTKNAAQGTFGGSTGDAFAAKFTP